MDIDKARSRFDELRAEWEPIEREIKTEQDARFQVINRILTDVLGWPFASVKTEVSVDSGYADYLAKSSEKSHLVVEAKRASTKLIDTAETRQRWYKVGGAALKSAADGIGQAKNYCTDTASMFAAVTTGFQWIGFWALRTDGKPPSDGRAAVFSSLDAISTDFALFFDLFSPGGIESRLFQVHVHEAEGLKVVHGDHLEPPVETSSVQLAKKSELVLGLERVYQRFFASIAGDQDREMLAQCFVESRESREADHSLRKIARDLISTVDTVDSQASNLLSEIRGSLETRHGEFVLIVGNKGAGKSTFMDRFFRLVIDASLRKRCLILKVDLANWRGNDVEISQWLTNAFVSEAEKAMFSANGPSYEQLQGVFMKEYHGWQRGEHKFLYERDLQQFKERFGEWMYETRNSSREKYLEYLLGSAIEQRKLMPCLIFDNTDHFSQTFQEAVFQYAQSIFRSVFSFVICPITDRSIWRLSKQGPLQSYNYRTFYLPVPSTKEVIAKRVAFLKLKVQEDGESGSYFLEQGIRLEIKNIDAFAASIEEVFLSHDYIARAVGWLSNHDIRRSLTIAERIITSPTLRIESILKAHLGGESVPPKTREIKLALIRGNYTHYIGSDSEFVANVFEVHEKSTTSPLIRLSILRLLLDREVSGADPMSSYIQISDIISYFEPMGAAPSVVREHLATLLDFQLIQPYDMATEEASIDTLIRIAPSGQIHYEFAFAAQEGSYVSEMALMTAIRSSTICSAIRQKLQAGKLNYEGWREIQATFIGYCLDEDAAHFALPNAVSYEGQHAIRSELRRTWKVDEYRIGQTRLEFGR